MKALKYLLTLALALPVFAEEIKTMDGRTILLNDDGTYEVLGEEPGSKNAVVEVDSHMFERHTSEYDQNSIRFMPIFKNVSDRTIVAIKFTTHFYDPFGDQLLKTSGSSDEKIAPQKKSTATLFYVFEDNPFISGEPYDKLLSSALNKTGKIQTTIDAIVFEGGEVLKLRN